MQYAKKISERKINLNSSMKKKVLKIIEEFFYCTINMILLYIKYRNVVTFQMKEMAIINIDNN